MTRVFYSLTASDKGLDLRTVLEVLEHLIYRDVLLKNFAHGSYNANRNGFLISINKCATDNAIGAVTSEEPRSALARIAKEAAFNNVGRKLNGFLSANSNLMNSRSLLGKTSLGGEEGVNAVSEDYNIRGNLVTKCKNALYLAIFNNEVFNCDAINKFSTSIFSLLCQPLVKGATQYGVGLLTSLFELTGCIINGEIGVRRHERNALMSHLALQRSFLIVRENLGQRMRIDTATGHVLGASVLTTLNDKNRLACGCEGVSSNRTCAASTDDNRVKIGHAVPFRV